MDPAPHEPIDAELDALLRHARPTPDGAWVHATGDRLLPRRERRVSAAGWLGGALAGGLATLALGLSLAGVGPLGGSDGPVQAKERCRTVTITRTRRVPRLITGVGHRPRVVYRREPVRRTVRRCG